MALDTLRGLAILAMMLSGTIPFGVLPPWMYHAQTPPPSHAFNKGVAGITWVDLVFPFFLFAMGVAIPLAAKKAVEKGEPVWRSIVGSVVRWLSLAWFAVWVQHIRPTTLNPDPTQREWALGLLGFGITLLVFARLPESWNRWLKLGIRVVGWTAGAAFLTWLRWPDGDFSLGRFDIIIAVLATMALFTGIVWRLTKDRPDIRLGLTVVVLVLNLAKEIDGSLWQRLWSWTPLPVLFQFTYLPYLLILLPATLVGDALLRKEPNEPIAGWRAAAVAAATLPAIPALLWIFGNRIDPTWGILAVVPAFFAAEGLLARPHDRMRWVLRFGVLLVVLGCLFEPLEGGIKKDPKTVSYLFAAGGMGAMTLAGLMGLERLRPSSGLMRFLAASGQNPMLAYVGINNLVLPIWFLTFGAWVAERTATPWAGVGRAGLQTLMLAVLVWAFSRMKIYLRSG